MTFIPQNIKRPIVSMNDANNEKLKEGQTTFPHIALRLNMKDWTGFALDLSGAQYGWFEPVVNFTDYMNDRIRLDSFGAARFGTLRERITSKYGERGTIFDALTMNNDRASKILKWEMISWEIEEKNMMVIEMCKLDQMTFEKKQKELLGFMEERLEEHLEEERERYFDAFEGTGKKPDPEEGDGGLEQMRKEDGG